MIAGALSWNADLLASGSRDRMIMLHDTRIVPVVPEKRLAGHRQEVCQPVTQHVTILQLRTYSQAIFVVQSSNAELS